MKLEINNKELIITKNNKLLYLNNAIKINKLKKLIIDKNNSNQFDFFDYEYYNNLLNNVDEIIISNLNNLEFLNIMDLSNLKIIKLNKLPNLKLHNILIKDLNNLIKIEVNY